MKTHFTLAILFAICSACSAAVGVYPSGSGSTGSGDFKADGSVAMTGDIDAGGHNITNVYNLTVTNAATFVGGTTFSQGALTATDSNTNYVANVASTNDYKLITCTYDVNFSHATNAAAGASTTYLVDANGTNRTLRIPSTWFQVGFVSQVSTVPSNYIGILTVYAYGQYNTNIIATLNKVTK